MSTVTNNMRRIFSAATLFHGDVSKWYVLHVTKMSYMFRGAISLQSDISE